MDLPFSIGDIIEVDRNKMDIPNFPTECVGRHAKVETMGINWIKVVFADNNSRAILSCNMCKRVEDEDTHRF